MFTLLSLVFVATHVAGHVPSEVYWKSVLQNTPMPKALKDLLHPPEWTNMVVGKGKPVNVEVSKTVEIKFSYGHNLRTNDQQLKDNPNAASLFFLEKDMQKGVKMNLYMPKTATPSATFLPRQIANKIPFSSNKFPEILSHFAIKPSSEEAKIMKNTINECEEVGIKGEEKYCATSLESMIDFSTSKLGKNVEAVSTEANKVSTRLQEYTIVGVKKMGADKAVVCHKQNYAYAVFYCHKTVSIKAFMVSLSGDNGSKANAVAVCHIDTKFWDTKYLGFQVLKVKRGTVPICHFLPQDHVIWMPY